jgi:hypothetical protein
MKFRNIGLVIIAITVVLLSSCDALLNVEKQVVVNVTVSYPGYNFSYSPEMQWYKDGVLIKTEMFSRFMPQTVSNTITYNYNDNPTIMAVVNVRNGFGTITSTKSVSLSDPNSSSTHNLSIVFP